MKSNATVRSYIPLTTEHLSRLADLAREDRERFLTFHPDFRGLHVATVLAQGGGLHWVNGTNGVKDLDVWTFFALPPGHSRFPADIRHRHVDFGPSELGRQRYKPAAARSEAEKRRFQVWSKFEGRRVDLMMRGLRVDVRDDPADGIWQWLTRGKPGSSPWFLAQKAVVMIDPADRRGEVIWAPDMSKTANKVVAPETAGDPWPDVLDPPRDILRAVFAERGEVYPSADKVFAAFHQTPFKKVRVVILGQDPYPTRDDATGLAFAVPPGRRPPVALRNIHAAMRAEGLMPPEDLTSWARQGVLLLNTALTVRQGKPGAHLSRWKPFTDTVLHRLSERHRPIVFVLWGREAQEWSKRLDHRHPVLVAPHPASRGPHQQAFRDAGTFRSVNRALAELGHQAIKW